MFARTIICCCTIGLLATGCGGEDDSASTPTEPTSVPLAPLTVLVTNDDGIGAPGLDALVSVLKEMEAVEVVVVAPAENQSGTSDTTTVGAVVHRPGVTASGVAGTAVEGYPAAAVKVALDELALVPDLVVSGVNEGQNVANFAQVSGTVGAARTALRRGIPAVASSAGLGPLANFNAGATLVAEWITAHRNELAKGTAQTATVTSFNVPGCTLGTAKAVIEAPLAPVVPANVNVFVTANCDLMPSTAPTNDVEALMGGYLVMTPVPAEL